jgi:hypothetical protein
MLDPPGPARAGVAVPASPGPRSPQAEPRLVATVPVHAFQGMNHQHFHRDRSRGHQISRSQATPAFAAVILESPAQITVGDDPHQGSALIRALHPAAAEPSRVRPPITSGRGVSGFKACGLEAGTIKSAAVSVSCLPRDPAGLT